MNRPRLTINAIEALQEMSCKLGFPHVTLQEMTMPHFANLHLAAAEFMQAHGLWVEILYPRRHTPESEKSEKKALYVRACANLREALADHVCPTVRWN